MKTMITMILNRLFGSEIRSQRTLKLAGEVEANVEKLPEKKLYEDPDLLALYDRYGELQMGKVITIELNECAQLLNRKRVRLDAFKTLQNRLRNDYGVELKIYSRRTKV